MKSKKQIVLLIIFVLIQPLIKSTVFGQPSILADSVKITRSQQLDCVQCLITQVKKDSALELSYKVMKNLDSLILLKDTTISELADNLIKIQTTLEEKEVLLARKKKRLKFVIGGSWLVGLLFGVFI